MRLLPFNEDFIDYIKDMEGNTDLQEKMGHFRDDKFFPYRGREGGYTVGFGHKLSPEEMSVGAYRDGISHDEAQSLLVKDLMKAERVARQHWANYEQDWDSTDDRKKEMLVDFAFNLGGNISQFRKFTDALAKDDWERVSQEFERHFYTPKGSKVPLVRRNQNFFSRFLSDRTTQPGPTTVGQLMPAHDIMSPPTIKNPGELIPLKKGSGNMLRFPAVNLPAVKVPDINTTPLILPKILLARED